MAVAQCPRCFLSVETTVTVDAGFRTRLRLSGNNETIPDVVCNNCYQDLGMMISSPTNLLNIKDKLSESAKMNLWRSRVGLIRKARSFMKKKAYPEAVIAYEKYLKIIEVVFNVTQDLLMPELLKEHSATKELTVLASVYWDLVRIYDTNEKYKNRMMLAAKKLGQFAQFTPMYVDLLKQAELFKRKAKHTDVINKLLKQMASKRSRCFVATSAFGSPLAFEVIYLSKWRDGVLQNCTLGRCFIEAYYFVSPTIAQILDTFYFLKPFIRAILRILIFCISKISLKNLQSDFDSKNLVK